MTEEYEEVLSFWFDELEPRQHFKKDVQLDAEIARRFANMHKRATDGELQMWRGSVGGRLAEIIVLDQFSRNIYRDDARAWSNDRLALALAQEMVELQLDMNLVAPRRVFAYLPYMHSEDIAAQRESVRLFTELGLESNLKFAVLHHDVVARFGRFPYRNALLGRQSSPAEMEYVEQHGSF